MFTTMMLSAILAMSLQPASQPAKPSGSRSEVHGQTSPAPPPSEPTPIAPAPNEAGRAAKGELGQPQIDHSPAARRDWDHRRAYYWQYYRRPYRRDGYGNAVSSGVRETLGLPSPPSSVEAIHNLDATVTVTWVMPGGVIQDGDVFEVGRRQQGQTDFWKIGETTQPRFVDRQLQGPTSGSQYAVAVRRGNLWSPASAIASATHQYYSQQWGRPFERLDADNFVTGGARAMRGVPSAPDNLRAVHNLDATVTVTWTMAGGLIQEGDVFEVSRRAPGEQEFSKIGEATTPRFVDVQLQALTSGTQYAVSVRRGNVWSPKSPIASTSPDHPLGVQRARPAHPNTDAPKQPAPAPQATLNTEAK